MRIAILHLMFASCAVRMRWATRGGGLARGKWEIFVWGLVSGSDVAPFFFRASKSEMEALLQLEP